MGSPSMLLDLLVEHDYFPNRACLCLEFRPDEQTASELALRRIPVRFQPGGFRVHAMPDSILDQDVRCRFHGWSEDPAFELYTDLSPASREQILSYSDSRLGTDGSTLVPSSSTQSPRCKKRLKATGSVGRKRPVRDGSIRPVENGSKRPVPVGLG